MKNPPCIAISGLQRMDNPQPGAGIVSSLRRAIPDLKIVGLVYDAMESGIYSSDAPDEIHLMSYPTVGVEAYFQRIDKIRQHTPFTMMIPTLDSEIDLFCHVPEEFLKRGIRTCLPTPEILGRRAKARLPRLAVECGVETPRTLTASELDGVHRCARDLGFPLMIKGPYYEAKKVATPHELSIAATRLLAEWGGPVILQECISGPEFDILGLGDGLGGDYGMCSIRKTLLSDKGKGLGGVTIDDVRLTKLCKKVIKELKWPGPFEIEVMLNEATGQYTLIEINPRFPAWVDFPALIGSNFSLGLFEILTHGKPAKKLPRVKPGFFYVRHQIEAVGRMTQFASLMGDSFEIPESSPATKPAKKSRSKETRS